MKTFDTEKFLSIFTIVNVACCQSVIVQLLFLLRSPVLKLSARNSGQAKVKAALFYFILASQINAGGFLGGGFQNNAGVFMDAQNSAAAYFLFFLSPKKRMRGG